jgi:hypothetical protein
VRHEGSFEKYPAMTTALDVMSGPPLFAAIVCRKFAIEAAMSWHLSLGIWSLAFAQATRVRDPAAQCPGS